MLVPSERPRPAGIRDNPNAGWLAVLTVCFGAFMGQLDASIVTLTFPALQAEFNAPLATIQWVSLAYLLTLVGLVAAMGRIADAIGRKLVYLDGFLVFTVASVACALSPNPGWLIAARIVQAVGAAMLQSSSVALVVTSVPESKRRSALGIQAAAQALGLALGPVLGGILVSTVGWHWVFWVNVPVGIIAYLGGRYFLPRTRERTPLVRFDWLGLVLIVVATTGILVALSSFSGLSMPWWAMVALCAVAAGALIAFVPRERAAVAPLVDLHLIGRRDVGLGLLGAFCAYLVLFGPLTLFPQVIGVASSSSGLVLALLPIGFAVSALGAGRVLPRRWHSRSYGILGSAITLAGLVMVMVMPARPSWLAVWLFVVGIGLGVFIPANNAMIMASVPTRASAVAGGLVNMARGLGTAVGVAFVTLSLHLASGHPETGARLAIAVIIAMIIVGAGSAIASSSNSAEAPR